MKANKMVLDKHGVCFIEKSSGVGNLDIKGTLT